MHDRDNEDYKINNEQDPNDEGWVYPDRLPGQTIGAAYGYDVRRRAKAPVNPNAVRRPRQPVNTAPGSMQRRGGNAQRSGAAPVRQGGAQPMSYQGNAPQSAQPAGPQRVFTDPRYPPRPPRNGQGTPTRQGTPQARQQQRPRQDGQRAPVRRPDGERRLPAGRTETQRRASDSIFSRIDLKTVLIAAAVILAVILLIILIPKMKGSGAPAETETAAATFPVSSPVTEQILEPEPEPPKYPYSERTADTKQFGADEISCRNAILIDVDTHTVVAEKGGDEKIFPASMTKVLTVLTAIDKCSDLNSTFTMTNDIVAPLLSLNATSAGFSAGEEVSVKDLMYGALLPSGADGTGGLAVYTSGSEAAFAGAMNEKCAELGLKGSHFSNASGLHSDDHYSTCHDIAIIFEAAMDNPDIAAALGSAEYTTAVTPYHPEGIPLTHTLLFERLEGSEEFDEKIEVIGGKTGFTDEAGNCLVTMAKVLSTGKRYIFVCAGGDGRWAPVYDTIHVYRNYLGEHFDGEYVPKYMR